MTNEQLVRGQYERERPVLPRWGIRRGMVGDRHQGGDAASLDVSILPGPAGGRVTEDVGQALGTVVLFDAGEFEGDGPLGPGEDEFSLGMPLGNEADAVQVPGQECMAYPVDMPRAVRDVSRSDVRD